MSVPCRVVGICRSTSPCHCLRSICATPLHDPGAGRELATRGRVGTAFWQMRCDPTGSGVCCVHPVIRNTGRRGVDTLSRRLAARAVISLVVASVLVADLGLGMWLAPGASAQMAPTYHWATKQSHFRLRVGDDVDGDWDAYLRAALDDWNQNETAKLVEVDGSTNPQDCQPVSGTVQVCDWWYGTQTGWLGLARLYFNASGDHIDAATVQLNDSFLYAPNSPYNSDAARRHTICHELGHTVGLDHPESTSCTNDSQYAIFNYVTSTNQDFRWLQQIYEHSDGARTVARPAEADLNLFAPATSPQVDSEEDVMVLPLDEQTAVLTFVIWADEETLAEIAATRETDQGLTGELGLDAINADTDGDGVADADELALYHTNPTLADTDGDSVVDGEELFGRHTDPLLWDDVGTATSLLGPDGTDTVTEGAPADVTDAGDPGVLALTAAGETDLDADNYADALEGNLGLDPGNPDTDRDGVADGDELNLYRTEPTIPDTDGDGRSDGEELFVAGTDPLIWDTDSDGVGDGEIDLP